MNHFIRFSDFMNHTGRVFLAGQGPGVQSGGQRARVEFGFEDELEIEDRNGVEPHRLAIAVSRAVGLGELKRTRRIGPSR